MRIGLTGGGTGGHFYPIISVVEEIQKISEEERLVLPQYTYYADTPYNDRLLFENRITYVHIPAGKWRRYFAIQNYLDIFKTLAGIVKAIIKLFSEYPDVLFSKGGYASFPAVFAARLLRIPLVIHESDSTPGRVNRWAAKYATRIAVSYPDAFAFFPEGKTAVTGNPIRAGIQHPMKVGAHEFLDLDPNFPTILVLGGSQGAQKINDIILDILPDLLTHYQVVHQVGRKNLHGVKERADYLLTDNALSKRYKLFDYLNDAALRMAAGAATLIISRAGSAIFEIAQWGVPSIIIPIPESISHDQVSNAFTYARFGGAVVMEENNLTANVLTSEINRLLGNPTLLAKMAEGAKSFARPDAARAIARELIQICLSHEQ